MIYGTFQSSIQTELHNFKHVKIYICTFQIDETLIKYRIHHKCWTFQSIVTKHETAT